MVLDSFKNGCEQLKRTEVTGLDLELQKEVVIHIQTCIFIKRIDVEMGVQLMSQPYIFCFDQPMHDAGEEYVSDSEDYEVAYRQQYQRSVSKTISEIKSLPLEEVRTYVQTQDCRSQIAEDIICIDSDSEQDPQQGQILMAIDTIKMHFPHLSVGRLMARLHSWMLEHQHYRQEYDGQALHAAYSGSKGKYMRKDIFNILNMSSNKNGQDEIDERSKLIRTEEGEVILTNKGMLTKKESLADRLKAAKTLKQFRVIEREVGAIAFCTKGYGIPLLREYIAEIKLQINIPDRRYKAISCGFSTVTWRRMQRYLIVDCGRSLKMASSRELRVLYTIIFNCRNIFKESQALTFVKFMRLLFELGEVEIHEEETMNLYSSFMKALQKKLKEVKFNSEAAKFVIPKQHKDIHLIEHKPNFDKIWTPEMDEQFYDAYLRERTISGVRDHFKKKFSAENFKNKEYLKHALNQMIDHVPNENGHLVVPPILEESFVEYVTSLKVLMSKFHKTIRRGLRKIEGIARDNLKDYPRLNRVSDDVVKAMFGSPQAMAVRAAIIDVIRQQCPQHQSITFAINVINDFNQKKMVQKKAGEELSSKYDERW